VRPDTFRHDCDKENDMDDASDTRTPAAPVGTKLRYVDRPECMETFADFIVSSTFDGQTLRLEFGVTRLDEIRQDVPVTGRRYPACRLVLSGPAALELISRMQQIGTALSRAGLLKQ
jgi:hypothetical protein